MATFDRLREGQILYDVRRVTCGNTTIKRKAVYLVEIHKIDTVNGRVLYSWNSNKPTWGGERAVKSWKVKKPELPKPRF